MTFTIIAITCMIVSAADDLTSIIQKIALLFKNDKKVKKTNDRNG